MKEGHAYCGACGRTLEEGARFCGACGQPVVDTPPAAPRAKRPARGKGKAARRHPLRRALVILVALLLAAGLLDAFVLRTGIVASLIGEEPQPRARGDAPRARSIVTALAFDAAAGRLGAGTDTGHVYVWGLPEGRRLRKHRPRPDALRAIALSADGRRIACGYDYGVISLVAHGSGNEQDIILCSPIDEGGAVGLPCFLAFKSQDRELVAFDAANNAVRFWHLVTGKAYDPVRAGPRDILCGGLSADQRYLALGLRSGGIEAWDLLTGDALARLPRAYATGVEAVAMATSGRYVVAVGSGTSARSIQVWDTRTRESGKSFEAPMAVRALAVHGDGDWLAGGGTGRVVVWNAGAPDAPLWLDLD